MSTASNDRLGIGIVGIGGIVQTMHLPAIREMGDAEVTAICDSNEQKAVWVADKFKIPKIAHQIEELLQFEGIDAVLVCTPNNMHYPMAVQVLKSGRDIFIEKPVARDLKETQKIVSASESSGKLAMVGMNQRFRHDVEILRNFVESGELGEIFYAKCGWMVRRAFVDKSRWYFRKNVAGGGVMMDLGVQMLDLALWLMGSPKISSVFASTFDLAAKLEVEDSASIHFVCEGGGVINIEVTWSLMTEKEIIYTNLFGTEGGALLNPLRIHKELAGNLVNVTPDHAESSRNLFRNSYRDELKHFISCLRDGVKCRSTAVDSIPAMQALGAAYKSAASGSLVRLKSG